MAISKWNPFGSDEEEMPARTGRRRDPFRQLQGEMNRMLEDFFNRSALQTFSGGSSPMQQSRRSFSPRIDVSEDDETVRISAELPGLSKDDIELEADQESVTIKGEKKYEREEEDEGYYHNERSYGYFRRQIPFPVAVDTNKAHATFHDGVLDVRFPKTGESKRKQLEIK